MAAPPADQPLAPRARDPRQLAARLRAKYGERITGHFVQPASEGRYAPLPDELPAGLAQALRARGIEQLYSHQAEAWDATRRGEHLVVVTPTASGKSLCYLLPVAAAAMQRQAILPHHTKWAQFFESLEYVVIDEVHGYRGGYLPNERREAERAMRTGQVDGIVSTSALELGVDIGALDVVVLNGYPGSVAATWQRIGRAGRRRVLAHNHQDVRSLWGLLAVLAQRDI